MCEPCTVKWKALREVERRCDRPGCTNTWTWSKERQIEAFAARKPAPKALCGECETKLASLEDKEVPCGSPGCTRKALVTKRQQLLAEAAAQKASSAEAVVPEDSVQAAEGEAQPVETQQSAEAAPSEAGAEVAGETDAPNGQPAQQGKNGHRKGEKNGKPPLAGVTVSGPFCTECEPIAKKLRDRPVTCGIANCSRKWIWKADEQLTAFAAGKPNEPPRRMCEPCRANFGKLLDREVRCRTSGCKLTWTWSRFDQLDACVADKPPPKAPSRMCQRCFDVWGQLKDVERPCRRSGCKGTWLDKRGGQLARIVRGKTGDPFPRYCENCEKELGDLQDREVGCKTEGCPGTWTWTKEQQLAAGVRPKKIVEPGTGAAAQPDGGSADGAAAEQAASEDATAGGDASPPDEAQASAGDGAAQRTEEGAETAATAPSAGGTPGHAGDGKRKKRRRNKKRREPQPPERRCQACVEFLANRKTQEIPCTQCGTPIFWPPESQLQTHLGNWAAPTLCGACKRDATEAARRVAKEQIRAEMGRGGEADAAESTTGVGIDPEALGAPGPDGTDGGPDGPAAAEPAVPPSEPPPEEQA